MVKNAETMTKELLVPSDQPIVRYREMLKDWEKNGWRLDIKTLRALQGDAAMAIPCPARATEKNWVLDEVPLVST
ncbi:MAG: hypothetical protein QF790_08795 [Gammaproteobacteria bacterium]|nr:hypothetical protein [Gammaproteobacteria bacterium]MDP6617245.1 hypothetical protein [Gammaproteobacteria bacterium]MDP6695831.1 hypothetical protein [Gammaproteobacteria bacterium]